MTLLKEAIAWHAAGYTPVPVAVDGSKRPNVTSWTQYQDSQIGLSDMVKLFDVDHDGLGLICGASSGHLGMLEAEGRAVTEGYVGMLAQAFDDRGQADLWQRVSTGYAEITPSGGMHWYYRVDGQEVASTPLARRPSTPEELAADPKKKTQVLIETRGQGGFTVIAPSAGRTHDTGQPYRILTGSIDTIPVISEEERDTLHAIASTLDSLPVIDTPQREAKPRDPLGGKRPGDDFNERGDWSDIIKPHGWEIVRSFGGNLIGWKRPGKRRNGVSATTGRNDGDNLFVFSTSTEFTPLEPYSKFSAYTLLNHGGDYSAAAKALVAQGYGEQAPISPPRPLQLIQGGQGAPATPQPVSDGATARVIEPESSSAVHFGPTEDGTARAVAEACADTLRYCPQRGSWLTWTGSRWQWDTAETHRERIRDLARTLPEVEGWKTYKRRALSAAGVTGIARLAQTDSNLTVHIDELDNKPYELNTPGGIINLRTGDLAPADPAALHTRMTPVVPDFDRESELLQRFLDVTFGADAGLIAYVQRLLGISAIGTILEQILPFAHGSGANGKSTLIEATMTALGRGEEGYAIAAPSEMLMIRKHSEHPAELAQLAGARLVVCSELDDGQRFAEARIKQLTGRDSVNARFMRGNPFTFTPSHTIWLIGNHKPDATTGGPAFWRRLKLVPFDHVVPETDRDPKLSEKLAEEAPAILAWLARGAADYMFGGVRTPEAVEHATEAYAEDQDTVGRFVEEQCHRADSDIVKVPVAQLRAAYERWCSEAGDAPVSARRLTQELRDRYNVESEKGSKGQRFYSRICLLDEERSATQDEWYR